jgi:hypothetical protein
MEAAPEKTVHDAVPVPETPPERQLRSGLNKVERLTKQSKGLFDDLSAWVELRLKLTQIEFEEKLDAKINQLAVGAVMGLLALFAVLFALVTLALGLGAWLGHPAWGFLIVTVLLVGVTLAVRAARPHLVSVGTKRVKVDESKLGVLPPPPAAPALPATGDGRETTR